MRAEIHEFILRNWRVVKIATTKAQRKLFFNLRSSKKRLGWLNQKEIMEVAEDLGVKPSDVVEMEKRMSNYDATFDTQINDEEESYNAPISYLENNDAVQAGIISFKNLDLYFMPLSLSGSQKNNFIDSSILSLFEKSLIDLIIEIFNRKIPFRRME